MRLLYINLEKPPINHNLFCLSLFLYDEVLFFWLLQRGQKKNKVSEKPSLTSLTKAKYKNRQITKAERGEEKHKRKNNKKKEKAKKCHNFHKHTTPLKYPFIGISSTSSHMHC
ncbi:hypothetical protein M441DRAFT_54119 [Trichoderma asperellum CBS 433.97]|uniref:Uncharacterized protein n=1 Tax=Trichoderma asperellum (strain ATCC 204424 / CBS 433.97 / NBRC 101777) TaxID=1042311 RepID=A0A2T3ZJN6_TRIA4|nr:hypothetical protein M441DRAFT_54119 [Trichoderma asperellum CBS 433.97]PTB45028.1 hypothetical protein M441DRAFT_54119 [Trichoderma asperellum CBS 433.97]